MGVIKNLRGRRFGRLKVPETAEPVVRGGHAYWPVICDCGAHDLVRGTKLREGRIKSCGCLRADPEVRRAARRGPEDDWRVRIAPEPKGIDLPVRIAPEPKGIDLPVRIAPDPVCIAPDPVCTDEFEPRGE